MLADQRRGGDAVERSAWYRLKRTEVCPFQAVRRIETQRRVQDIAVRFLRSADDELGRVTDAGLVAQVAMDATEAAHDFAGKIFGAAEPGQVQRGRRLHVQRYPVRQGDGSFNFRFAGPRQDFQMDVAAETVASPQDLQRFQQFLHRAAGRMPHAGTEEQSFHIVAAIKLHKQVSQFLRRKPAARYIATGAVGAV